MSGGVEPEGTAFITPSRAGILPRAQSCARRGACSGSAAGRSGWRSAGRWRRCSASSRRQHATYSVQPWGSPASQRARASEMVCMRGEGMGGGESRRPGVQPSCRTGTERVFRRLGCGIPQEGGRKRARPVKKLPAARAYHTSTLPHRNDRSDPSSPPASSLRQAQGKQGPGFRAHRSLSLSKRPAGLLLRWCLA